MEKLDTKSVWLFFFGNMLMGLGAAIAIAFALAGLFVSRADGGDGSFISASIISVGALVLYLAAAWVWARLSYHFYRYELREDGFRKEHGVIWKKYITIPYDRIQNVDIHRGILARLLGLSDLQIQTAGGITAGSYGAFSEGRLPGIERAVAESIRDELVKRTRGARSQGL